MIGTKDGRQQPRSRRRPLYRNHIRNLDAGLKERLRVRAAQHGHSMETEVRDILQDTLKEPAPPSGNLYERIRTRFAPLGGVDLDLPPRKHAPDPPRFD